MRLAFVVLFACSAGAPRERSPQPPAPADASVDGAVDAAVAEAVVVHGVCDWNKPDPNNPRCAPEHMPLMRCRDVNGPSDRFPKCIEDNRVLQVARPIVLAIKRRGDVTERGAHLLVDGGADRGIDESWRVEVLDGKQRALRGAGASIVRVGAEETEVVARMTAEQIDTQAKAVRFTPPKP